MTMSGAEGSEVILAGAEGSEVILAEVAIVRGSVSPT